MVSFNITQLTNNNTSESHARVSGNNVVWSGWDGQDDEIYYYNNNNVQQITNNTTRDGSAEISGNNIVWLGRDARSDTQVYYYNGSITQQLTNTYPFVFKYYPQISGNHITWMATDGIDSEIWYYNGSTVQRLTDNDIEDQNPQIYGDNVVWWTSDTGLTYGDIYYYDGNNISLLASGGLNQAPEISSGGVVWLTDNRDHYRINYVSSALFPEELASNFEMIGGLPQISGNHVVWSGIDYDYFPNWNNEIYYYDGTSMFQLTNNNRDDLEPQISGNNIVWRGYDGQDWEIFYSDGTNVQQLTNNNRDDLEPQISGNNIVWRGYDGQDWEIFLAEIVLNANPTNITLSNSSIPENEPANTVIGTLTTIDPDVGQTHRYTLVSGVGDTDNSLFSIVDNQLRANQSFDYETRNSYSIRIRTTDNEGNTFEKTFTINVTDVAENNPPTNINLNNNSIPENEPANTVIGTLTTIDPDAGQTHSYSLVSGVGDADNNLFSIVNDQLRANQPFDYENRNSYSIRVRTTDNEGNTFEKTFTINVTDVAENNPPTNINLNNNSIPENEPANTVIGTLTTIDPDAGQTHSYSLVSGVGDADNNLFSIVNDQLRANQPFDYENRNSYSIRVRTTDNLGGTFEKTFTINIANVFENNPPTNINLSNNRIPENEPANTVIGTLTTIDPDVGQTYSYSLVSGVGDTDNSLFSIVNNQLRANQPFDYESRNSYSIRVRTTDNLGGTFERTLTINVTDVNDNNPPANVQQLTNNGTDDTHPQISGNNVVWWGSDGHDAEISIYNGISVQQLTNNAGDDYDPQISGNNVVWFGHDGHDWEIYYYNGSIVQQLTNNATGDISPQISGNNIVWVGSDGHDDEIYYYNGSIVQQLTNNTTTDSVPQISGNKIVWVGSDGQDWEIYYYNGSIVQQLTNNATTDSNPQISGNNVVWWGDDGQDREIYYYNGSVVQQLTNNTINDYDPQISGDNVAWWGNDGQDREIYYYNGSTVRQLTDNTTDDVAPQISGNNIVWHGYDGQDEEIYYYNGSIVRQLSNNTRADYEHRISGNSVVWVNDDGHDWEIYYFSENNPPANNPPTNINLSNNSIPENRAINTVVGTLATIDPDGVQTYSYSLVSGVGDTDNSAFRIVNNQLRTTQIFDYENQDSYNIRVRTTDNSGGTFEKTFTIDVTDVAENNPPTNINLSNNRLPENRPRNTFVGTLNTIDPDGVQTHSYSLVSGEGDTDNSAFRIVNNQLLANQIFDYESRNNYSIRVRTTDNLGGTFEKAFTINITDLAENNPPTDILLRRNSVPENRPRNTFVGRLNAVDLDGRENHSYSLVSGEGDTDNLAFGIVNEQLRTAQRFDYETQNSYSIRVRTIDNQGSTFEKAFTINVTDIAEHLNLSTGMSQGDSLDRLRVTGDMLSFQSSTRGDLTHIQDNFVLNGDNQVIR